MASLFVFVWIALMPTLVMAQKAAPASVKKMGEPQARVIKIFGDNVALNPKRDPRDLELGSDLYVGDTIYTRGDDSYVVLVFTDESKLTVQPRSKLRIDKASYKANDPGKGQLLVNLLRGGLRMLTGLVGKANPKNVKVQTPTATIGIRGTGFDVSCIAPCTKEKFEDDDEAELDEDDEDEGRGLSTYVWQGSVEMRSLQAGYPALLITEGKTGNLRAPDQPPVFIELPAILRFSTPRPDGVPVHMPSVFGPCANPNSYGAIPPSMLGGQGGQILGSAMPGSMAGMAGAISRGQTVGPDTSLSQMGLPDPDQGMQGMRSVESLAHSLPKMQQLRGQTARMVPPPNIGNRNAQRDCE